MEISTLDKSAARRLLILATLLVAAAVGGCSSDSGTSSDEPSHSAVIIPATSSTSSPASGSKTSASTSTTSSSASSVATSSESTSTSSNKAGSSVSTASAGQFAFASGSYTAQRGAGVITVSITRELGSNGAASVNYETSNGSAMAGTDYTVAHGTVSWANGDSSAKVISIQISESNPYPGNKQFSVKISSPSAPATLAAPSAATVVIAGTLASKSIKQWATCDGKTDDSRALAEALDQAQNNAFTLVIDCPVRVEFHEMTPVLNIADGTTIEFTDSGEVIINPVTQAPFQVKNPADVTLINWNVRYPS
jgi:hypothetical protein